MENCCSNSKEVKTESNVRICRLCNCKGKKVQLITLKSLLKPSALETLSANENHYFCSTIDCNVVYFDANNKKYLTSDIKVPVHQKDESPRTPICYCFDWTKYKIKEYVKKDLIVEHIRENIKENRCGCEVNNPQGSCCLGNVTAYIRELS
ncbi:putative iron-sulfur cluster-binding metallochaperone [Bacillus sp. B1-b2]|uniref:putative iron-sulfur cluster-binding metallochaperone n=2 Tax=Bacillus TaxID=1386 RepID=UPI00126221E1|nr:(2Fe-2S)-binding protein [Bacillus sp. B1-b2]KAB7668901.1 (2Fe-2S)-binding protein [Bacillus sp. B1-b2]